MYISFHAIAAEMAKKVQKSAKFSIFLRLRGIDLAKIIHSH
jgi:hypothetical protein